MSLSEEPRAHVVVSTLRDQCGVCDGCISLICRSSVSSPAAAAADASGSAPSTCAESKLDQKACKICLGIITDCALDISSSSPSSESPRPLHPISKTLSSVAEPYGGIASNPIAKESPTVALPAFIMARAYSVICAVELALKNREDESSNSDTFSSSNELIRDHVDFYDAAKEYVRSLVRKEVIRMQKQQEEDEGEGDDDAAAKSQCPYSDITPEMAKEEAGYLGIHLLFVLNNSSNTDEDEGSILPPSCILRTGRNQQKRERKRFRGNDPTNKQGGDPKINLMQRVKYTIMGGLDGAWNIERNDIQRVLNGVDRNDVTSTKKALADWIINLSPAKKTDGDAYYSTHAAVWRKPFYVGGKYTKARRDVSQSPFYVPDGPGGSMIKKGISSIEEEICPVLSEIGCHGIAKQNNEASTEAGGSKSSARGLIVYGMCKFHASGREDIDVRMLLPAVDTNRQEDDKVEGRPFVCEVIDAHRVPTPQDLVKVMNGVNRTNNIDEHRLDVCDIMVDAGIVPASNQESPRASNKRKRRYGSNPNGVDIADISYASSSAFKGLQGETENKIKHYGCAVWCERPIHSQEELDGRLGVECKKDGTSTCRYPSEIHQSTPLRVLHRRAAAIRTRHVLTLTARRVNEHWFALHISTSAGTYVKEFVHGDCGRTKPSISSMLGCKTDIVRLDCEGIQM